MPGPAGSRFDGAGGMGGRVPMTNGRGPHCLMDSMPGNMGMGNMPFQGHVHGGGDMRPPGGFMAPGPPGGLGFGFGDGRPRLLDFLRSARRA